MNTSRLSVWCGAYINVRQSIADRLLNNPESLPCQHALAMRARSLCPHSRRSRVTADAILSSSCRRIRRARAKCLLVGIVTHPPASAPRPLVDRSGEGACLGDVEVALLRRVVGQYLSLATREVCSLSRLDQLRRDAGQIRASSRKAANQKPTAQPPVDTRPVPCGAPRAASPMLIPHPQCSPPPGPAARQRR
jgi:hypothetical protein